MDTIQSRSGSAEINAEGQETLQRVATTLREDMDHDMTVQGHTDSVRIGLGLQSAFPTNWELSTARATAVVRFLQGKGGLDPHRLSVSGFSYYRSVVSNDTGAGRCQHRRIDLVLVPTREGKTAFDAAEMRERSLRAWGEGVRKQAAHCMKRYGVTDGVKGGWPRWL